jgi:hypothetical protein
MLVRSILGGIAGAVVCGIAAFLLVSLMAIGSAPTAIESAVFALSLVLLVALGGIVLGVWVVLKRADRASAVAGHSLASLAVLVAIGGAIAGFLYMEADTILREPVQLEFEIRLPGSYKVPPRREQWQIELRTDKNTMPAKLGNDSPRRDGDKLVVGGAVDLYFKTANRALAVNSPGQPELFLQLKLAANPYEPKTMTAWRRVTPLGTRAANETGVEVRYRIKRAGEK